MRIGLVGAGAVAGYHASAARALDGVVMSAVCDLKAEAAHKVADPLSARVFLDYREMYASGLIDAVIVNTPHGLHLQMVRDAAEHGLQVLVEKPMATTVADCSEMIETCAQAGVALVVGHIQHFLPDKQAAHEALSTGEYGAPLMVHDFRSTDYRPGSRAEWFFSESMAGGGALMNIGGHCLDRSIWMGGAPAVSVRAQVQRRFGAQVETDGAIQLTLANGVDVSISVVSDTPHQSDELTIVCEQGVIVADPRRGTSVRKNGITRVIYEPQPDDIASAFRRQLADFVQTVAGGAPRVSLEHARHVVELVLASYRSAEQNIAVVPEAQNGTAAGEGQSFPASVSV